MYTVIRQKLPSLQFLSLRNVISQIYWPKDLLNMPKNYTHHAALKERRLALKKKGEKFSPGIIQLHVLGSGTEGTPKSLYLFSDQNSYLFNCGEGTQRLANEHKRKLRKLEHIFITKPSWDNVGGLPGLALTVQDVGIPTLTLHGPEGLDQIFSATKRFIILNHVTIQSAECSTSQDFEDSMLTVKYVPLLADNGSGQKSYSNEKESPEISEDDTDYYWHEKRKSSPSGKIENPIHSSEKEANQSSNRESKRRKVCISRNVSMAFICQLKPKAGTLILEKCVEQGVPVGPMLGQLKAGKDVTLPNGTIVRSVDVRKPDDPGPVFIVVDCPSISFLDALINEKVFERHQKGAEEDKLAYLVVHFSHPDVIADPRYQTWMKKFSPTTNHLIINESNKCSGSVAIHEIQHQLNLFDKNIFPLLRDSTIPIVETDSVSENNANGDGNQSALSKVPFSFDNSSTEPKVDKMKLHVRKDDDAVETKSSELKAISQDSNGESQPLSVIHGRTLLNVELRPDRIFKDDSCLVIKPKEFVEEVRQIDGFNEELDNFHSKLSKFPETSDYPRITFLGTGSSIPNKIRNTSGILLQYSSDEYIILDCGEGTYGQIVRIFGDDSNHVLSSLRAIFVSHLHADHHIGLIGLLQARKKAMPVDKFSPIHLLAPHHIMSWLHGYHQDFEPILDLFKIIPNSNFLQHGETLFENDDIPSLLKSLNLIKIQTARVIHCPNAFGISLTHKLGWKITYSGDTMPCQELVEIGMGSDVLIHEATMEDDLLDEAILKLHSTTSQAIEIGEKMNAKFTLLTHFSQRYAKLPNIPQTSDNVGIAFDCMQVRLGDLRKLPLMLPALKLMFIEHCEEMKVKLQKRQRRIQMEKEVS